MFGQRRMKDSDGLRIAKSLHDFLRENPGKLASEIYRALGISEDQLNSALVVSESCGILFYAEMVRVPQHQKPNQIAYFAFEG